MTFLVLVQGYAVFDEPLVSITQAAAVAIIVGGGTAVSAYVLEHRIAQWSARRAQRRRPSTDDCERRSDD